MGVGPLIHTPFLLEHSLSECGFRPGGDGPSPPLGLRVGVGYFLRLWVRVVRESAARLEIVLQTRLRVSARSHKHFLFLRFVIITHTLPPTHWHKHVGRLTHRTTRERHACASRQPDSEVHVRVSTFTLHTQQLLAHAVTVRRASEPGPCWNFSYINPTSDMLSLGCRCRFRRASTSTRRLRGSHHTGCSISHSNRTGGHQRMTHIDRYILPSTHVFLPLTPCIRLELALTVHWAHLLLAKIVRSSLRPFRVGVLCSWTTP